MDIAVRKGIERAGPAFRFCPSCASGRIVCEAGRIWTCPDCGFLYFHNVAAAAGIVVETKGGILLLRRAKEPRRGFLALPGGFVDSGEGSVDCALRECEEEIGWKPSGLEFLASFPNLYEYRGIPYATSDDFFAARFEGDPLKDLSPDPGEVAEILVAPLGKLPWDRIAFESTRKVLALCLKSGRWAGGQGA
jgi:ADP-ribose pyrophosphatase YjhB (NUDIX family)